MSLETPKVKRASLARDQWKFLHGINRDVTQSHVETMKASVQKLNQTRPVIISQIKFITGKNEWFIIDGQHLTEALIALDRNIIYIELKIDSPEHLIEVIALLNATSKAWTLIDYVKSWSWLPDKEDYKKLLTVSNETGIGVAALVMAYSLTDARYSRSNSGNIIKSGQFKIKNHRVGDAEVKHLTHILKEVPRNNRIATREFVRAFSHWFHKFHAIYDHTDFILYVARHRDLFRLFDDNNHEAIKFMNKFRGGSYVLEIPKPKPKGDGKSKSKKKKAKG